MWTSTQCIKRKEWLLQELFISQIYHNSLLKLHSLNPVGIFAFTGVSYIMNILQRAFGSILICASVFKVLKNQCLQHKKYIVY
jgi:hypothetical protein